MYVLCMLSDVALSLSVYGVAAAELCSTTETPRLTFCSELPVKQIYLDIGKPQNVSTSPLSLRWWSCVGMDAVLWVSCLP